MPDSRYRPLACLSAEPLSALPRRAIRAYDSVMSDNFHTPVSVDPRLLEILICPVTRGRLTYDRTRQELVSKGARLAYPIRDGVPIMLPEEARKLD